MHQSSQAGFTGTALIFSQPTYIARMHTTYISFGVYRVRTCRQPDLRPTTYTFYTKTVDSNVNTPTDHEHHVYRRYVHNSTRYSSTAHAQGCEPVIWGSDRVKHLHKRNERFANCNQSRINFPPSKRQQNSVKPFPQKFLHHKTP